MRTEHLTGLLSEIDGRINAAELENNFIEFEYKDYYITLDVLKVWLSEGDNVSEQKTTTIVRQWVSNLEVTEGDAEPVEFTDDQQTLINNYLAKWTI
jgi:hypothetical protein